MFSPVGNHLQVEYWFTAITSHLSADSRRKYTTALRTIATYLGCTMGQSGEPFIAGLIHQDPLAIADWVVDSWEAGYSASYCKTGRVALGYIRAAANLPSFEKVSPLLRYLYTSFGKRYGKERGQRYAIAYDSYKVLGKVLDGWYEKDGEEINLKRRVLICLGFNFMLRHAEALAVKPEHLQVMERSTLLTVYDPKTNKGGDQGVALPHGWVDAEDFNLLVRFAGGQCGFNSLDDLRTSEARGHTVDFIRTQLEERLRGKMPSSSLCFHGLRHGRCTELCAAAMQTGGVYNPQPTLQLVQSMGRWRSEKSLRAYLHVSHVAVDRPMAASAPP